MNFFNELAATSDLYSLTALVLKDDLPLKETLGLALLYITVGALSENFLKLLISINCELVSKCRARID